MIIVAYSKLSRTRLDYKFLIERKSSLSELAGNFTQDRADLYENLKGRRLAKIHMVVESATWKTFNGTYHSNFT